MNYTEEVTLFECTGDTLVGILARPETPARTGVVVIVGGLLFWLDDGSARRKEGF